MTRQCEALGLDGAAPKRFTGSWLIREIQATQKKMIKAMKEEGGIRDAWGSWLKWEETTDERTGKKRGNERHLLSRVCQSFETRLITEVALASGTEYRIALYCFDGAVISFLDNRPERVARVQAKISELVAARSREWLGAVIPCEWALLGGAAPAALPTPTAAPAPAEAPAPPAPAVEAAPAPAAPEPPAVWGSCPSCARSRRPALPLPGAVGRQMALFSVAA